MTTLSNALDVFESIGNREDLSDIIYNVAPSETPVMSAIGRTKATGVLHEWQTDTLRSAAANAQIEGEDASVTASTVTKRLVNRCQLSNVTPAVTGTQEAILKAGRRSELAYQIAKQAKELKTDMELDICSNTSAVTGSTSAARVSAGIEAWIATNDSFGGGSGASPTGDGTDTRTDGTQRPYTEALLKGVIASMWDAGGDPNCIFVGSFNKQKMSTFTGNATRFKGAEDKKLVAAIDLYQSDFGDIQVKPSRFSRSRTALVLQTDMWALAYLRPFRLLDLAKTGDHERRQLLVEYCLEARQEAASGSVADLTTA